MLDRTNYLKQLREGLVAHLSYHPTHSKAELHLVEITERINKAEGEEKLKDAPEFLK
jgi:hypothetical protein